MTKTLLVGPFNRVEGDLEIRLEVADGRVSAAYANSPMFRGFERMMLGKKPVDALTVTPRICGICSISQSAAAALALSDMAGVEMAENGARVAALLHAVENISDHITHFYVFFMPDFARVGYAVRDWHGRVVERFTAGQGSGLRAAIAARAELMHVVGMLGGKWPHTLAIQPGGVTRAPSVRDKVRIGASLKAFRRFLEREVFGGSVEAFVSLSSVAELEAWTGGDAGLFLSLASELDLAGLGKGPGRYLSFGAYPGPEGHVFARGLWSEGAVGPVDFGAIEEDLSHAWMLGEAAHPLRGETRPDAAMEAPGYSWCKAPRLGGETVEVGALARQVVDGHPLGLALASEGGVRARVAARLLEVARTQLAMEALLAKVAPEASFMTHVDLPKEGVGVGLVEAARGALGHWIGVEKGVVAQYQIIAPTTWNFSPRDAGGVAGPCEAALVGAPVAEGEEVPLAVQHVVRSFDPCMVCTVH
jgi:hydrogenase large subunit